jgi:plasmid stabilization system protein ParE
LSRFYLTPYAAADLEGIRRYFTPIPERFGAPIRRALRAMLHEIATNPQRGNTHSEASRILGQDVKTRVVPPYRFFYRDLHGTPEILAILHTAQDVPSLLRDRLQ